MHNPKYCGGKGIEKILVEFISAGASGSDSTLASVFSARDGPEKSLVGLFGGRVSSSGAQGSKRLKYESFWSAPLLRSDRTKGHIQALLPTSRLPRNINRSLRG
jgi:hypothetical protein